MRRHTLNISRAAGPYHEMPVTDTRIKFHRSRTETSVYLENKLPRLTGRNMTAAVVLHNCPGPVLIVLQRHQITAKGDIVFPECNAHARRLKRCPAGIV